MQEFILYGIIEFSTALLCSADALGQSVNITIRGNSGILTLPTRTEWESNENDSFNHSNKLLLGPIPARTWKRGDALIYWGKPISYPSGESDVERALFEFKFRSEDHETNAQQIYQGFGEWLDLFEKYVIILTTQNTRCRMVSHDGPGRLELLLNDGDKLKYISKKNIGPNATIYFSTEDYSLHLEQLMEAARLSSLGLPPKFEYVLFLEAYNARRNADYRKAIIEAANALEICLTERIMVEFNHQRITFGEKLLQKFRMLGGRFELIKLLGVPLPNKDYEALINKPRNDVVHRGAFPDQALSNRVISEVEELLRLFSPQIYQDNDEV
jgi:hypothetical protein